MNELKNEPPPRYKWPWIAAGLILLGIISAVIFVAIAARNVERERDFNAPLPSTAPAH